MDQNKIFRKVSLDRLSSPEQLDHQIRLISPVGWIALAALGVLIAGALVWGFMGSVYKKVSGQGVLMYGSGITNVMADSGGMITDLSYKPGDKIEKGDIIARISQDELVNQIQQTTDNLEAVKSVTLESLELGASELNYSIYPDFASLAQQIRVYRAQKKAQSLEHDKNLKDKKQQIEQQETQVDNLRSQLYEAKDQLGSYAKLMKYQRDTELDNADNPTQSTVGLVYSDKSGVYYSRTFKTKQQMAVLDQAGAQYAIFGTDTDISLPIFFRDNNGKEYYNPGSSVKYYLPAYSVPGDSSIVTSPVPATTTTQKIYYSAAGAAFIDPTNTEFVKVPYTTGASYDQIKNSPSFDATLASFETQVEGFEAQLSQAELVLRQLKGNSDDYLNSPIMQVDAQIQTLEDQFKTTKRIKQQDLEKQLGILKDQLSRNGEITATVSGTILELNRSRGDFVQQGQAFCSIVKEDGTSLNQEVVLYVPADEGKKIIEGMMVNVSPSTVNREEYGYIIGMVKSVSDYVVSSDRMMSVLNNQQLVQAISGNNSALLEVNIELLRSTDTQSGYKWSTPKGAPMQIDAGTICGAEINVQRQRPIDMVVPYLKNLVFGSVNSNKS